MARARANAPLGLVHGLYQVGARCFEDDCRLTPAPSRWFCETTPRFWDVTETTALLQSLGFCEVEMISKTQRRRGAAWSFRALRHDDLDHTQTQVNDYEIQVVKDAKRKPTAQSIETLATERRVRFGKQVFEHNGSPDDAPAHLADEPDEDMIETDRFPKRSRHVETTSPVASDAGDSDHEGHEPAKGCWTPSLGTISPNDGNGDCLWHSLAAALSHGAEKKRTHRQLRAFTVQYMRRHIDQFGPAWDSFGPKGEPFKGTFNEYLDLLQKVKTWSGALELSAFTIAQKQKVYVFDDQGTINIFNNEANDAPAIFLKFHSWGHFEWLQNACEDEFILQHKRQVEKGGKGYMSKPLFRGGGRNQSSGFAKPASPQQLIPASSSIPSCAHHDLPPHYEGGKGHLSAPQFRGVGLDSPGLSDFASNTGRSDHMLSDFASVNHETDAHGAPSIHLSQFASIPASVECTPPRKTSKLRIWGKQSGRRAGFYISPTKVCTPVSEPESLPSIPAINSPPPRNPWFKRGSAFPKGDQKALRWVCPHCPFVFEASTSREICLARTRHNVIAHKGKYQVGSLRCPVALQPLAPDQEVSWKCPLCDYGLTGEQRQKITFPVFKKLRTKHRHAAHADVQESQWRALIQSAPTDSFRHKRRIHLLNVAASKRKIAPSVPETDYEHFVWPALVRRKKVQRVSLRNAFRCRSCLRCFETSRDTTDHMCVSLAHSKCTKDRIIALEKLESNQQSPPGLDSASFVRIIKIAVRALKGHTISHD